MTPRLPVLAIGLLALVPALAVAQVQPQRMSATMVIATDELPAGSVPAAVPLVEERLTVSIDGQYATTTLLQAYQHDQSQPIEGRYELRPGSGSRVEGFAYWNNEEKIVGEVFEKQVAYQVYDRVTSRKRDPGLLEEVGEGAFAFKIFPIAPREKKRVEIVWSKWLERDGKVVTYRAPIGRSDASVSLTLLGSVQNVKSSTHTFHMEKVTGGQRLRFDGAKRPSELVLTWEVDDKDWTPHLVAHTETDQDGWFTLSLAAPDMPASAVAAKDVTLVIDRSGSMQGEPLRNAKAAAVDMIQHLDKQDRLNIVAFSDEVDPLYGSPQALTDETRVRALAFVEGLNEGGGTDIALALKTSIGAQDRETVRPRVVVFLTDGQSNVGESIAAAADDQADVRLFTIGVGPDVNRPLLTRLAEQKRGRFTYIANPKQIQSEVSKLADQIASPLLIGISIDVEGAQAIKLYPRSLPDIFAHDQLVVSGRTRGTGTLKMTIKGTLAGKAVSYTASVDLAKAKQKPWVGRLWAQARVDHLLEEIALGDTSAELPVEVTELALAYNFVTPYTAFLAIPESELGDAANTLADARARKQEILKKHPDAVALTDDGEDESVDAGGSPSVNAFAAHPVDARQAMAPGYDDGEYAEVTSKKHGCAGCATGETSAGSLLLALLALVGLRRRR